MDITPYAELLSLILSGHNETRKTAELTLEEQKSKAPDQLVSALLQILKITTIKPEVLFLSLSFPPSLPPHFIHIIPFVFLTIKYSNFKTDKKLVSSVVKRLSFQESEEFVELSPPSNCTIIKNRNYHFARTRKFFT